jgi:phosphopantothenoylcysteine decarboxylase / phosphopantothenate---cysteine ligase
MLKGKKIILGITGSIAAYKAAILLRLLVKEGAEVQVLITPAGKEFITPVTLSALSGKPVESEFFGTGDGTWHSHVDMGIWADLMLIAPCSANTLGKMAGGICDNLLLTTYMSAKCPVFIAPAMDLDMYRHPANQKSIAILRSYGSIVIDPAEGELASGLCGKGRMQEPEVILEKVKDFFMRENRFAGSRILINAGPTFEPIDKVRYIGNYSSGKMGFALAHVLASQGAEVDLISGPVELSIIHPGVKRVNVVTASEMYQAVKSAFSFCDAAILTAAVADFTPVGIVDGKIKSSDTNLQIELKPTVDIAASLGKIKKPGQVLAGFALESDHEIENARRKLIKKNLDFIVLNSLNDTGAGFGFDTNQVTVISHDNNIRKFELKPKDMVALDIADILYGIMQVNKTESRD